MIFIRKYRSDIGFHTTIDQSMASHAAENLDARHWPPQVTRARQLAPKLFGIVWGSFGGAVTIVIGCLANTLPTCHPVTLGSAL